MDNKNKFNIGDLVKAQKGLFNDEDKGGYGIILSMGMSTPAEWRISKPWALIRWPDGTTTKIVEWSQGWAQTEVAAKGITNV